jgi:hypothetical protein
MIGRRRVNRDVPLKPVTTYHSKSIAILGRKPKESSTALAQIDDAERRLGIRLPPSVRQWYAYKDAIQVLASHSNDDRPIPLHKFELEQWNSNRLLAFKHENQGVCVWSILLDESDDPPVYVNVDDNGWNLQADTFSDYVYSCIWDYAVVFARPALVQAQNDPVSDDAINTLAAEFAEQLRTYGWPGCTQYRFAGSREAILIWSAANQADWFVAADDAETLRSVLQRIWGIDAVGQSLYDCSEIGKTVLEELREKEPSHAREWRWPAIFEINVNSRHPVMRVVLRLQLIAYGPPTHNSEAPRQHPSGAQTRRHGRDPVEGWATAAHMRTPPGTRQCGRLARLPRTFA